MKPKPLARSARRPGPKWRSWSAAFCIGKLTAAKWSAVREARAADCSGDVESHATSVSRALDMRRRQRSRPAERAELEQRVLAVAHLNQGAAASRLAVQLCAR